MNDLLKGCDGCYSHSNRNWECDTYLFLKHLVLGEKICPCGTCIVKMICNVMCDDYIDFNEELNVVINKTDQDAEANRLVEMHRTLAEPHESGGC